MEWHIPILIFNNPIRFTSFSFFSFLVECHRLVHQVYREPLRRDFWFLFIKCERFGPESLCSPGCQRFPYLHISSWRVRQRFLVIIWWWHRFPIDNQKIEVFLQSTHRCCFRATCYSCAKVSYITPTVMKYQNATSVLQVSLHEATSLRWYWLTGSPYPPSQKFSLISPDGVLAIINTPEWRGVFWKKTVITPARA